jgi:hypothetical protein
MSEEVHLLMGIPWFAWIPLSAIVLGITAGMITKVVESSHRHRERMAMIRAGMHPDAPQYADAHDPYAKPSMPAEV